MTGTEPKVVQLLGPSTGGIRRVVASLTAGLRDRGWNVTTAGPRGVLDGLVAQDAVVPVGARSAVRARRALAPLLDGVDVVHAHGLTAGWIAAVTRPRPPVVVSVHNLVLDEAAGRAAPALRRLESMLPAMVDLTLAVSPEIARRFSGRRGGGRVRVVPPAAEVQPPDRSRDQVRADLGVADRDRLVVAATSRLHPQKDIPTLLRALVDVERATLAVFGTGPDERELRMLVAELGLEGRVVFGGQRPSLSNELAAADVAVVPSRWESGPLMLVEAMLLGVPVVSTPVGLAADLVVDGITGRLVPIGQPVPMARAIDDLLSDPALAARLASAGRARAALACGPEAMVEATIAAYREVLA